MNTTENIDTTAEMGAPDPLNETGLIDADAALAAELGLPGEDTGEVTQTTPDEVAEGSRDSDDADTGLAGEDGESEDLEEEDTADAESEDSEEVDDDDGEAEEGDVDDGNLFDAIPKEHHDKVGKLISQAKQKERSKYEGKVAELEQKAAGADRVPDLEAELASVKAQKVVPAPTHDSPYADHFDGAELARIETQLWDLKQQLQESPDTYKVPDAENPGEMRYASDQEVRQAQALVDRRLQRDLPARKEWLARHQQYDSALVQALPEINDPKSALHQGINQMVGNLPLLKTIPGYRNTAAIQVIGQMVVQAKGAESFAYAQRLVEQKGEKPAAPKPKKKAVKKASPAPRSSSTPRRPVSTSAGHGGFNQDAFEREILGEA